MDIISQMKKIWPDWTVVDKIGAGSYGHVYKVSRIVADRTYYSAVKVITVPQNEGEVKAVFAEEGSHSATKAHFKELVDDCIREITIMMDLRGASNGNSMGYLYPNGISDLPDRYYYAEKAF